MKILRLLTHSAVVFILLCFFPLYMQYGQAVCKAVEWTEVYRDEIVCSSGAVTAGGIAAILVLVVLAITIWHFFSPSNLTKFYKED